MKKFTVAMVHNVAGSTPTWVREILAREGIQLLERHCANPWEMFPWAESVDVLWLMGGGTCITAESLAKFPNCGAILRAGSGTDNVPVAEATRLGIIVANTPDAIAHAVAEHAVALLLATERRVALHDRALRKGRWQQFEHWPESPIHGKTLGLVGFGHIAQLVAKKMGGFELKIIAADPVVTAEQMARLGARKVELDELLTESDYVSLHCPLTDKTRHLVGEAQLRRMKKAAVLVNTSRGPVIDEAALVRALREGWIAGAGLDVMEVEPIQPDNPLLALDNVVLTPHTAAHTQRIWEDFFRASAETLIDLSKGRWPRSYVNREVKPKWKLTPNN